MTGEETRDRLRGVQGFVFDLDGTLVLGDRTNHGLAPLPGARQLLGLLGERGVPFVVLTNGTGRTPDHYARILREIGFPVGDDQVLTPATSAADVFGRRGHRRVMLLGTEGVRRPLEAAGIEVVRPRGRPGPHAVLVAWYRDFTMDDLDAACHAVWDGARLYSGSQSRFFATATGPVLGTSRAITAMIRDLTGARVEVVGKPSAAALGSAARRLGVTTRHLAVVGDDPALEVPMALRGGAMAVAVATGIAGREAFDHLPPRRRPHLFLDGVDDLAALYRQALA
ncbi:MAG TPA: HAD hydrolase-like protein [Acidimicrobiales bacterium]|nr:HAD hydrolase-like protein [Acidimicrobiales bacterium]